MAEMGFSTYRFSISWSRVFPDGVGEVNEKGIEFYRKLIDELLTYGIEPIVTLYHYDLPWALVEKYQGGWIDELLQILNIMRSLLSTSLKIKLSIGRLLMSRALSSSIGHKMLYPERASVTKSVALSNQPSYEPCTCDGL